MQRAEHPTGKPVLLQIGPFPEPKGGVSMHLKRLCALLENHYTIERIDESYLPKQEIFNIRSADLIGYLRILKRADIVHIHSGTTLLRILHLLASRMMLRRRVLVTMHAIVSMYGTEAFLNRLFLRLASHVIVVSAAIDERLGLGNTSIQPAFIPPAMEDEPDIPPDLSEWLRSRKERGLKILAGNAYRIDMYHDEDMYGIDLCIELMHRLVHVHHAPAAMLFIVASLKNSEQKFREYSDRIRALRLEEHMLLCNVHTSFVRIIERSDIVLRPTCTDGDALTVREALYLAKPVIASDVAQRPPGTVLFHNRDIDSLEQRTLQVLDNPTTTGAVGPSPEQLTHYYNSVYQPA